MVAATEAAKVLVTKNGVKQAMAIRATAEKLQIPERFHEAIRQRLYRLLNPAVKVERAKIMTPERRDLLVDLVAAFSFHANPLSGLEVRCLAQVIGDLDHVPSTGWLARLREEYRHKIKLRKGRCSHKKNVLVKLFEALLTWVDETAKVLIHIAQLDYLIFNIDETRAIPGSKSRAVLAAANLTQVQYESVLQSSLYTLVGCYAADGSTLFILYLFRARKSKTGVYQDFHAPKLVKSRITRSNPNVPIYVALTPMGYMNKAMWMETMKIFVNLVGQRQGLGRQKQAILYLDGCSSHGKVETKTLLQENNITAIYFPANTSQIVQPADGAIFQNYKPTAAKEVELLDFNASMGIPDQKYYDLAASLEAHRKSVTPTVIRAGFKKRGIYPWEPNLILANAYSACPQDSFLEVSKDVHDQLVLADHITYMKEELAAQKELQRKVIEEVNVAMKLEEADPWKDRRKGPKKKAAAPPPKKKQKTKEIEYDSEEDLMDVDDIEGQDDETDFAVPRLVRSLSDFKCSACGHVRGCGKVPLACFNCSQYWLCSSCRTNTNALAEHMLTHKNDEGRGTRRTRKLNEIDPIPL